MNEDVDIGKENPAHDKWFIKFYENGEKLAELPFYLHSLWAWQARSISPTGERVKVKEG